MIITDKNRIDNLAEELFDNISYRHELSEDDYRVVSRHSKQMKAAFFQSSWFTAVSYTHLTLPTMAVV